MSEIDELQQALDELASVQLIDNTWQEAEVVRREITGIVQALHRDLCAASADLREREGLRFQIDQCKKSRERLKARAEAAEAEAAALKKLEAAHRGEEAQKAAELHKRLAALEFAYGSLRASANILEQQLADVSALVPEVELLRRSADYALCTAAARHQPIAPGVQEDVDHKTLIMLAAAIRAWRGDGDGGEERG